MIRSAAVLLAALLSGPAAAEDSTEPPAAPDEGATLDPDAPDPLSPYRTRFDLLAERTIGTASKPVAFNWRRTKAHVAATGSLPAELNNFNTLRAGALLRLPAAGSIFEIGASYAHTWNSPSSQLLAFTPYRQPGRPNRMELDLALAYPMAEGVVTAFPRWFPAVELVFNLYVDLRYSLYPAGFPGMKPGKVVTALLSPSLTEEELENLDDNRLDSMQIDPGRYGFLVGFGNDLYFEQGVFVSPRVLIAVPILAPASQTELYVWADFSLAIGMAF